jgi:5-methylcytosine-specific restriction endonuclease McrA
MKEKNRTWYKNNKDKSSALTMRKKARKFNALGNGISAEQANKLKEETGFRCVYCGVKSNHLHIDHVEPISRGGRNDIDNAVPACPSCNKRKNNTSLLMFFWRMKYEY